MNKIWAPRFWILSFVLIVFSASAYELRVERGDKGTYVSTIYGSVLVDEPVLQELLESKGFMRLQKINQYGISYYVKTPYVYTRYEHSLGVFVLLRKFGASVHEQIAGLLHDVSHTVFSHVGDHIFKFKDGDLSYQDSIHTWYLKKTDIAAILEKHGITVDEVCHKNGTFKALERDLPQVCADRLEYNLLGGYFEGVLSEDDITFVINTTRYQDGNWYFVDKDAALKVARAALHLTNNLFATAWNYVIYDWFGKVLRRAVKKEIITVDDIHFSTDDLVMAKLTSCTDTKIQRLMQAIYTHDSLHQLGTADDHTVCIHPKCRSIDPLVKTPAGLQKLSVLDNTFCQQEHTLRNKLQEGIYIKRFFE